MPIVAILPGLLRVLFAVLVIAFAWLPAPGAEPRSVALPQSSLKLIVSAPSAPAGSVAQVRLSLAHPIPISSGAIEMEFDPTVFGQPRAVDVFSAAGDQTGSASFSSNRLKVSFSSRSGGIGRIPGVPILVVTIPVLAPSGASAGMRLIPSDTLWRDAQGNRYLASAELIRFRVSSNLSIDAVTPGGGLLPEGSRVRIEGRGFTASTIVSISGVPLAPAEFISPNAVDIRLVAPIDLTGRQVTVRNSSGESADFFPALRPGMVSMPNGELSQYVFPQQLFVANYGYDFALQNPYLEPVTATLSYPPLHTGRPSTSRSLNLQPGEVFYSWMDKNIPSPNGAGSAKPIRVAVPGILYASGLTTGPMVSWIIPPPSCSGQSSTATDETCWPVVAGAATASAKIRIWSSFAAYAATVQTAQGAWLKVSPDSGAGGDITVTVDPSSLAPGEYKGTITVSFDDASYTPVKFPVRLRVVESAVDFRNAPPYFFFTARHTDPPPPPIQVDVTATKDGTPFRIDFASSFDTAWLLVTPREGVTPATLNVTVDPRILGQDIYRGLTMRLIGPGNTVTKAAAVELTESVFGIDSTPRAFFAKTGGVAPAPQTIAFGYSGYGWQTCSDATVASGSTQSGGSWLNAARTPGSGTIAVSANPAGLVAGIYEGAVSVAAPNNPECPTGTVPVALMVANDDPAVSVEPATIDLTGPSGSDSNALASMAVQGRVVLTEQRYPVDFSFTATSGNDVDWLIVSSDSAKAPGVLKVRGNATDLPPGTYRGSIQVNAPPKSKNVVTVPVTFHVGAALPVSPLSGPPLAVSVVDAASQVVGAIAPGELVTIHGVNLASDPRWVLPPNQPGVRVYFDDVEATVLYARPTQLNIAAPIELAGKNSVRVAIEFNGLRSVSGVAVAEAAPGLFTADSSGVGQALALNLPNEELNTALKPAVRGSEVRLMATGLGRTAASTTQPILPISVKIANMKADIKRIAPSSGAARGLFEIDVVVPTNIDPGPAAPVVIVAGPASSPEQVTIAVK